MEPDRHANPLEEALSAGSQRVAQLASLTAAAAQVIIQRKMLRDARQAVAGEHAARLLREQEQLLDHRARLTWAPTHDPSWLTRADLAQTGRAWASAASRADTEPAAASAMRKCEDRLRRLHPYAMARYDRLRDDGMDPLDAMREAAPLFARNPNVRAGEPTTTRSALAAVAGDDAHPPASQAAGDSAESVPGASPREQAEARGQQIAERLQTRAVDTGCPPLDADELTLVLETVTNLPDDVITTIARQASGVVRVRPSDPGFTAIAAIATAAGDSSPDLASSGHSGSSAHMPETVGRSPALLASDSFPHTAAEAIRAAATRTSQPAHSPGPVSTAPIANLANHPARPA